MFIVETGDQNVGWVGGKTWIFCSHVIGALAFQIEILIHKLCAVSIANNGILVCESLLAIKFT